MSEIQIEKNIECKVCGERGKVWSKFAPDVTKEEIARIVREAVAFYQVCPSCEEVGS